MTYENMINKILEKENEYLTYYFNCVRDLGPDDALTTQNWHKYDVLTKLVDDLGLADYSSIRYPENEEMRRYIYEKTFGEKIWE